MRVINRVMFTRVCNRYIHTYIYIGDFSRERGLVLSGEFLSDFLLGLVFEGIGIFRFIIIFI